MRPDWCPFAATASELQAAFARSPIVCAGSFTPEGKLTMRHPLTGALIDVTAPLPEDMQALLR